MAQYLSKESERATLCLCSCRRRRRRFIPTPKARNLNTSSSTHAHLSSPFPHLRIPTKVARNGLDLLPRRRPHGLLRLPLGGRPFHPLRQPLRRAPRRPSPLQDAGGARMLRRGVAAAASQRGGGGEADVAAEHGVPELLRALSGYRLSHLSRTLTSYHR